MIITLANLKGGVNKTTIATNLAHGLAKRGLRTCLFDFDRQGQCATFLGLDPEPGIFDYLVTQTSAANVVRETGRENLWLLPGNSRTNTAETVIRNENALDEAVNRLDVLASTYDVAVIDTPPSGLFQEMGLLLADALLIPVRCEMPALEGVAKMMQLSSQIGRPHKKLLVPTDYHRNWNEHKVNLEALQEQFPTETFCWPIARRAAAAELPSYGATIYESKRQELEIIIASIETLIDCVLDEREDCTHATTT